jgi:L-iditol 2-dehydrogenase
LQLQGVKVVATDLLESRLKLAKKFGAQWTLNANPVWSSAFRRFGLPPEGGTPNALSTEISRFTKERGLDAAVIAVPSDAAVKQALQLVRGAGQVLLFAHTKRADNGRQKSEVRPPASALRPLPSGLFPLDLASVCLDEKDLLGSYSADFTLQREVARLVFSRQLDVRSLITHRFPLAETADAIALASNPKPDSLKILVEQKP